MKEVSRSPWGMRCPWKSQTCTSPSALQPGRHWAAMGGKRALKSVELLSLDPNQAGHGGSSVIHLSGGAEWLARTQPCPGCWGLAELHASISPSCEMKTNACQPSALRDLINECLSSDLSRDPFNERFHKQCKA